jgi:hypothetical protein
LHCGYLLALTETNRNHDQSRAAWRCQRHGPLTEKVARHPHSE